MKTKDWLQITSVAFATAALTVMAFWPDSLNAGNEGDGLKAKIARPKLVEQGVELTVGAAEDCLYVAGDEPTLALEAVNTTAGTATVTIGLQMTATAPASPFSRLLIMPASLWTHKLTVSLEPNETRIITIPTDTKLPANNMIAVLLQSVNPPAPVENPNIRVLGFPGVVGWNFSTGPAPTQTASAK